MHTWSLYIKDIKIIKCIYAKMLYFKFFVTTLSIFSIFHSGVAQIDSLILEVPVRSDITINNLRPLLPDTLHFHDYVLVVEKYTNRGFYNNKSMEFSGLSGYGRVLFTCSNRFIFPGFVHEGEQTFANLALGPQKYIVVDSVRDTKKEIALKDARFLQKDIRAGGELTLMLPHKDNLKSRYLTNYLKAIRTRRTPLGVQFEFEKIRIQTHGRQSRSARVIEGLATYASVDSIPVPPFKLSIEGFILEVEEMTLFPDRTGIAFAKLLLPKSISQGEECKRAMLDIGKITLTQTCEFIKTVPFMGYGRWNLSNINVTISGKGFTADFSSTTGSSLYDSEVKWKGLRLQLGATDGKPSDTVISNTGYLCAKYNYPEAQIDKNGFSGDLETNDPYSFTTIQPYDYNLKFERALLSIRENRINDGLLEDVKIRLPEIAVRDQDGNLITISTDKVNIENDHSITGEIVQDSIVNHLFAWGELANSNSKMLTYSAGFLKKGLLFIPGELTDNYYPISGDQFIDFISTQITLADVVQRGIHGLTLDGPRQLLINSPDLPNASNAFKIDSPALMYTLGVSQFKQMSWLNIGARGVNGALYSSRLGAGPDFGNVTYEIGDTSSPFYVGNLPFQFCDLRDRENKSNGNINLQFVESAVFHSDVDGAVKLPAPVDDTLKVTDIVFTSTAHISGGKLDLSEPARLDYWGLDVVPKPGHSTSGVLSVKTGQIILTAAGLAEPRHFTEPFYVNWGEILADGSHGRLFFDYNTSGQQFDRLDFAPGSITLSKFDATKLGFLRTAGHVSLPYFGASYLHVNDIYDTSKPNRPFFNRQIEMVTTDLDSNFLASNTNISGNWSEGMAVFDFDLTYNDILQDGFLGTGLTDLKHVAGGSLASTINITAEHACISVNENLTRTLSLMPGTDITGFNDIWGCLCIRDNQLENLVYGGSVTNSSNTLMVGLRSGQQSQLIVRETPAFSEFTIDGQSSMSAALSLDLLINGHMSMLYNHDESFVEGEVSAYFRTAAGVIFTGSSLSGQGQANWHISLDPFAQNSYQSIQGSISLAVMGFAVSVSPSPPFVSSAGAGSGLDAGFYFGLNAPKSEAWVIQGADPRYQFEMSALPDRLSGVYGYVQISDDQNFLLFSGGYEVFAGFGAFVLFNESESIGAGAVLEGVFAPGIPYVLGNLGGRLHGEILGGFVSASALFNLQVMGPYPFLFQGRVGLEGCVAWVACKSVNLDVGLSSARGFYID